jgi:hypothetical protein
MHATFRLIGYSLPAVQGLERLIAEAPFVYVLPGASDDPETLRQVIVSEADDRAGRYYFRSGARVVVVSIEEINDRAEAVGLEVRARMDGALARYRPFYAEGLRLPWARLIADALKWHLHAIQTLLAIGIP